MLCWHLWLTSYSAQSRIRPRIGCKLLHVKENNCVLQTQVWTHAFAEHEMQALTPICHAHLDGNYALIDTALEKAQVFDEEHPKHCSCHI